LTIILHPHYIIIPEWYVVGYIINKRKRNPKEQSRMNNPEKLVTLGTQEELFHFKLKKYF